MTTATAITVSAMWLSTAGTLCYLRKDVGPLIIIIVFGIAAWTTAAILGVH